MPAAFADYPLHMKLKQTLATKAKKVAGKIKAERIAKSGLTSRIRGHVSARGRRAQGRRDAK